MEEIISHSRVKPCTTVLLSGIVSRCGVLRVEGASQDIHGLTKVLGTLRIRAELLEMAAISLLQPWLPCIVKEMSAIGSHPSMLFTHKRRRGRSLAHLW
jgi:hypothetical protein